MSHKSNGALRTGSNIRFNGAATNADRILRTASPAELAAAARILQDAATLTGNSVIRGLLGATEKVGRF